MKLAAIWRTKVQDLTSFKIVSKINYLNFYFLQKRKAREMAQKKLQNTSKIYDINDLEEEYGVKIDIEEEKECFRKRMIQRGLSIQAVDINVSN